jgi:hypothetical protein
MIGTTRTLTGLMTATALALAAPAAFAAPAAHGHGATPRQAVRAQAVDLSQIASNCALEYDYVFAGGQCATDTVVLATGAGEPVVVQLPSYTAPRTCPGEYDYIYPGSVCGPLR